MKNDIYDLLNDIDNQIDTFETVDITSTDLKNWKQSFALKKKTSVKKHTWKKYAAAAAAFMKEADALIVGSPVYLASPSGQIIEFMDKFASKAGKDMIHKPAAAVASARRAGTTATLDVLIKYFTYHQMPVVSGNYWTMVHGNTPDDVRKDAEGLQIMRTLGNNMAWLLKCIEAGKKAGIDAPETEQKIMTNFIR